MSLPRKKTVRHQFTHLDRAALIEQDIRSTAFFTLSTGFFTNLQDLSSRELSFIQKQLRQYLYSKLTEANLQDKHYVLNLGFPASATVKKSFVDLTLTAPMLADDLASNEGLCREIITKMRDYFE